MEHLQNVMEFIHCPYFTVEQNYKTTKKKQIWKHEWQVQLANCLHDTVLLVSAVSLLPLVSRVTKVVNTLRSGWILVLNVIPQCDSVTPARRGFYKSTFIGRPSEPVWLYTLFPPLKAWAQFPDEALIKGLCGKTLGSQTTFRSSGSLLTPTVRLWMLRVLCLPEDDGVNSPYYPWALPWLVWLPVCSSPPLTEEEALPPPLLRSHSHSWGLTEHDKKHLEKELAGWLPTMWALAVLLLLAVVDRRQWSFFFSYCTLYQIMTKWMFFKTVLR